jgi:hypothetical protein
MSNSNGGNSNRNVPINYNEKRPDYDRLQKISFFMDQLRELYMKKPYNNEAIDIVKKALKQFGCPEDRVKALEKELGVTNGNKSGTSRKNRKSKKSKKQRKNRKTRRN